MAEFVYWGTWHDSLGWLQELVSWNRFTFVIDQWYKEPVPFQFRSLNEDILQIVYRRRGSCYLYSDNYSRFPPAFYEPNRLGEMMIDEERGGPALRMALSASYEQNGRVGVSMGWLSYQSQYQNPGTGEWYKPPAALKEDFGRVQRFLRKGMVKRYIRVSDTRDENSHPRTMLLWIGHDGMRLLETGTAGIQFQTRWVTFADLFGSKEEALR